MTTIGKLLVISIYEIAIVFLLGMEGGDAGRLLSYTGHKNACYPAGAAYQ